MSTKVILSLAILVLAAGQEYIIDFETDTDELSLNEFKDEEISTTLPSVEVEKWNSIMEIRTEGPDYDDSTFSQDGLANNGSGDASVDVSFEIDTSDGTPNRGSNLSTPKENLSEDYSGTESTQGPLHNETVTSEDHSCALSLFGCCPNSTMIPSHDLGFQGCCASSDFGCCSDHRTPAYGPYDEGCDCENTKFGCCPDGVATAMVCL